MVVLTARDVKKGIEAIEKLKHWGLSSENVVFHQLDVLDSASIATFVAFIQSNFRKLDILVCKFYLILFLYETPGSI